MPSPSRIVRRLDCRHEGSPEGSRLEGGPVAHLASTTLASMPMSTTMAAGTADSSAGAAGNTESTENTAKADYSAVINSSIWFLTAAALLVLALRIYCKARSRRKLWWDDYILALAWIALAVASALTTAATGLGFGSDVSRHLMPAALRQLFLISNLAGLFSLLAATWSKTSFALTLVRIADGCVVRLLWVIIVTMNLIIGTSAVLLFFDIDVSVKVRFFIFSTAFSGAMDVVLSLLPWKIIWSMSMTMNKREKVGVLVAMSMGVFAGATSIIKITKLPSLRSDDLLGIAQLVIFGIAEGAVTVIAASIPVLRALLRNENHHPPKHADFKTPPELPALKKCPSSQSC